MSNGNTNNLEIFYANVPDQLPSQGNSISIDFIIDVEQGSVIDISSFTLQNQTNSSGILFLEIIFGHQATEHSAGRLETSITVPTQNLYVSNVPIEFYVISYNDGSGKTRKKTLAADVHKTP